MLIIYIYLLDLHTKKKENISELPVLYALGSPCWHVQCDYHHVRY